jgi:hypothetical protein
MTMKLAMKLVIGGVLTGALAFAQCSMCRTALAANSASAKTLDLGVVVLFVPAMCVFCGVMLTAYRGHRGRDE